MTTGFSDSPFDFAQGSVFGFRTWYQCGGDLVGHFDTCWSDPTMTAECVKGYHVNILDPTVPHPDCTCGIYAFWSPYRNVGFELKMPVGGIIEGSGRTLIGSLGFRTQHAQIRALSFVEDLIPFYDISGVSWNKARLRLTARVFGVPFYESNQDMIAEHPLTTDYLSEKIQ